MSRLAQSALMNRISCLLTRLYNLLLRSYPRRFGIEFGEEMQAVFAEAVDKAALEGSISLAATFLRELRDWPGSLWREYRHALKQKGLEDVQMKESMQETNELHLDVPALRKGPAPWGETLLAMIPWLLQPVLLLIGLVVTPVFEKQAISESVGIIIGSILVLTAVVGWMVISGIGLVKGFPRWVFPYWSLLLLFALYMMNVATPGLWVFGYTFGRGDLWGWLAWIPIGLVVVVVFLMIRTLRPVRQLASAVWHDWTLLSFTFYGTLPWVMFVTYDEVHNEGPIMAVLMSLLSIGALLYMRSTKTWQRATSLLGGLSLAWVIATLNLANYWSGRQESWMTRPGNWAETAISMTIAGGVLVIVLLAPFVLGIINILSRTKHLPRAN